VNDSDMSDAQVRALVQRAEAYLSPEFRAQLLQSDAALANALRDYVDIERAKFSSAQIAATQGSALKVRTTLYPDKHPRAGNHPSFVGSTTLAGRIFSIKAWIASNGEFINIELAVL
jgi:hypothetical protein